MECGIQETTAAILPEMMKAIKKTKKAGSSLRQPGRTMSDPK